MHAYIQSLRREGEENIYPWFTILNRKSIDLYSSVKHLQVLHMLLQ